MVGKRLRLCRTQRGISQQTLANHLSLTFQQIQKYEKGANRISCSMLYEIATFLNVPIEFFFLDAPGSGGKSDSVFSSVDISDVKETTRWIEAYVNLPKKNVKRAVVALLESVVEQLGKNS